MPLSAIQYTRLRDLTGGRTTTSDDDHLTDAELQAEYDDASEDWSAGVVYVLRRRLGMLSGFFDVNRDLNSETRSQKRAHLKDLLKDAEDAAGLSGGVLTTGTLDMNLDTDYGDMDIN